MKWAREPPWQPGQPPWAGQQKGGPGWHGRPPWVDRQASRHRGGPGPAIVSGIAQVVGCSLAAAPVPPLGYVLLLAGPFALLFRGRFRAASLAVAAAATAAYEVAGYPGAPTFVAALIALLGTVREGSRWAARVILLVTYAGYVVGGQVNGTVSWGHAVAVGAWTLVAYGFAEANRVRVAQMAALARAHAEEERARAEQERAAEEQQRRRAIEERLRIARELHDVLGHHLSLINVQAGVGLHLLKDHPEQAKAALQAIKQASSEALGEVRGVLAALRPQGEAAPKTPAPGLADVGELVATAGLPVDLTIDGTPSALPPDLDRAAYRIIQEALTNVRRHAGPGSEARLTLVYAPDRLGLRVANNGGGVAGPVQGNGIAGMRERATALGGTLRAEPRAEGGFEVVADLPVRPTS
jgi:signal transduction histidine kinase